MGFLLYRFIGKSEKDLQNYSREQWSFLCKLCVCVRDHCVLEKRFSNPFADFPIKRKETRKSRTDLSRLIRFYGNTPEHNNLIQSRTPEKKAKNHVTLTRKLPWKSCSTTHLPFLSSKPKILKAFLKTFPTKMKPTKCPTKEKKWGKESEKIREERKRKVKVKTAVSLLNPITRNLLSAHARTLQANILHLDQKATKSMTCKRLCRKASKRVVWQNL